jgi:hypothetical protein
MSWTYLVCDLTGSPLGQPLAKGRNFAAGVSRTETASFTVDVGSRLWSSIAAGDTTLKVYNSASTLVFWGDIVSDEIVAEGQAKTVSVTAADLSYRLARRFVGKSGVGVAYTSQDSGLIVFTELAAANAEFPTGITAGTRGTFLPRTLTLVWRRFSDVLADLGAIANSYEWTLRYVDGTPPTVYLDLLAQVGADNSSTVYLEYGTGQNNLSAYRRVRSIDQLATRVYALTQGSTNNIVAYDPGAETVRRFEDTITAADITDTALLDSLAAAHVAFRHLPRRTVTVTPTSVPAATASTGYGIGGFGTGGYGGSGANVGSTALAYGVTWAKGDIVSLRAVVGGTVDTDGTARVWAANVALDELGNESPSLTLEPQ